MTNPNPELAPVPPRPDSNLPARPRVSKVLLLNPPADDLVIRDNYCSKTTKSNVVPQPIDLLMQSGRLAEHFEIEVLDCIVTRTPVEDARSRILSFAPDAIFFLSGAVSWAEDLPFLARIKEQLGGATLLVGSGDIFQEDAEDWLTEHPFLDALLQDFSNNDLVHFLIGEEDQLENIDYSKDGVVHKVSRPRVRKKPFETPLPRHELFRHDAYHFSFIRQKPWATVMTDFGCPYPCTFCIQSTIGSKYRTVDSVLAELHALKDLGVREIFFHDQTWGIHKERNLEICRRMVDEKLEMGWTTFTRVDLTTEDVLKPWRDAGCHTLMFGVEFASGDMLRKYRKGYRPDQIIEGLRLTRKHGIRTVGTFLLGLPEETRETLEATIDLACELPLDFASFNVAVPRHGTPLRSDAKSKGLITDEKIMDQSGSNVLMPTQTLTREEIAEAKRRANRRFYLRPSYLARRLMSLGSWREFQWQFKEGAALLSRNVGRR